MSLCLLYYTAHLSLLTCLIRYHTILRILMSIHCSSCNVFTQRFTRKPNAYLCSPAPASSSSSLILAFPRDGSFFSPLLDVLNDLHTVTKWPLFPHLLHVFYFVEHLSSLYECPVYPQRKHYASLFFFAFFSFFLPFLTLCVVAIVLFIISFV